MTVDRNIQIKTNQLEVCIDFNAFNERYEIFRLETTRPYFKYYSRILDKPLLCNDVCSIYFTSQSKSIYVLMHKNVQNMYTLQKAKEGTEDANNITISCVKSSENEDIVLSLLLNALGSFEGSFSFLSFNNLTGHLYCFTPGLIEREKDSNRIRRIISLEIAIRQNKCLMLSVRTFTRYDLIKRQLTKEQQMREPKYVFVVHNQTLRRRLTDDVKDRKDSFVLRQIHGEKSHIDFLNVYELECFKESKMGILQNILTLFNDKYQGICKISFKPITVASNIVCKGTTTIAREDIRKSNAMLNEIGMQIVDGIGNGESLRCCNMVKDIIEQKYSVTNKHETKKVKPVIRKRISKERLNICLIHDEDHYKGKNDPHKNYIGATVQHITLEDFRNLKTAKSAVSQVIHELLIKHDIERRKISLFNWDELGMLDNVTFGMGIPGTEQNSANRFFFMRIQPDGSFEFIEQKDELVESANEYSDCVNILADSLENAKDVAGLVRFGNGDINIIRKTNLFTIPEFEDICDELKAGNNQLRKKENRDKMLSSITDIKLYEENGVQYYFVGVIGNGMQENVVNAANIRKIEPYYNSKLRFDELLPLMNVAFVRNNQLTVVPFPFKYLKEYVKTMQGI